MKQVGEQVDSDEPLVELETDKVNIEVPSPLSGTLSSIKVNEGDTVAVGALLGTVNGGKSSTTETIKEESIQQKSYTPPKKIKQKTVSKKSKESDLKEKKEKESLQLVDSTLEKNQEEAPLILDTLVENETNNSNELR